jgi:hypothetical protein
LQLPGLNITLEDEHSRPRSIFPCASKYVGLPPLAPSSYVTVLFNEVFVTPYCTPQYASEFLKDILLVRPRAYEGTDPSTTFGGPIQGQVGNV